MAPRSGFPRTLIGLLAVATLVRIGLAAGSLGSNDILPWYRFAGSIEEPIPFPVALTGLLAWGSLVMFVNSGLRPRNLGPAA